MKMPGLPTDLGGTIDDFKTNLADIQAATEAAADAAVAALIGEHGTDYAAQLLRSAQQLRRELAQEDAA